MLAEKTLALVNQNIEATQENSFRAHLGASVIGDACERKIFYGWRWALLKKHPAQLLRLFNRGHLEEARFIAFLRAAGLQVWEFDDRLGLKDGKGQQIRVSDFDGHFGGSLDGIARGFPELPPKTAAVTEYKTHNAASFKKLLTSGVMGAKFEHYVQMQVYMHKTGLKWAVYFAVNKDTDEWHIEIVEYDEPTALRALERAGNIIYANEPPPRIANSPGHFKCNWCDYKRLCHFGDVEVHRNCRTCRFSRPAAQGLWLCGLRNVSLDKDAQLAGCGSYQTHSKLQGVQA